MVVRAGQIRDHVAPLIIGHDNLDEPGGQVGRFRDHPNARFRAVGTGDHALEGVSSSPNGLFGA